MNNTIHTIAAVASLCLFVSCAREVDAPALTEDVTKNYTQMTFEAFASADADASTRTVRDADGSVLWQPNDEINIFCGNDNFGRFISDDFEVTDHTTFTGHFADEISGPQTYWAVYPYSSAHTFDGTGLVITVPAAQTSSPGSFGRGVFPSVAKSNSTSLYFLNVCGGVKFSLIRDDIDLIRFTSNGEEPVAGKIRVSFDSHGEPVSEVVEGMSSVTLRPAGGGCFEHGADYFLSLVPGTLHGGFTMSFRTKDGQRGEFVRPSSLTIKRSIFSRKGDIDAQVSDWTDEGPVQDLSNTGVYLGILAFNQSLYSRPVSLLTGSNLQECLSFIDGLQMKNGTILYYAADTGLTEMQQAEFPVELSGANLVTFTDGLDQGSLMMNPDYETEDRYLSSISSRIRNGSISGSPLSAYSIGIRGNDVQNTEKFNNNLRQLASSDRNAFEITEMSQLNAKFNEIAETVAITTDYTHDISLTIPGLPDGTRVRFTFDDAYRASESSHYIEGTFNLRSRTLSDISYTGLTCRSGAAVAGVENGIFVKFDFIRVRMNDGSEISDSSIRQWQSVSGGDGWQVNSEFDSATDTDLYVSVSRKSNIVYLVLDCSASLGDQFATMKQYAKNFVRKLYNDSYIETNVTSVRVSPGSASIEKDQTIRLSAMVYPATALDRTVQWSSSNPAVATVDENGLVTGVSVGTASIYATSTSGGRKASCSITVFEQTESQQDPLSFSRSGLYLGILAFNQSLYRYPIGRLTAESVDSFCSFIDSNPLKNGSLVYYAANQAVTDIQAPEYPADLSNAALVTFTDCLDQGSFMKESYQTNEDYLSAVNRRITGARVNSRPLTAYSIGIRGGDVTDIAEYKANLAKLATSEANAFEITDINTLQDRLDDIADVVSVVDEYANLCNLSVTIPGPGNGTRVRFTFDNVSDAAQSGLYIEGTFNLTRRTLTNVTCQGFFSNPGSTIQGTVNGIFVTFTFENLQRTDNTVLDTRYLKEWTADSGQSNWQVNSEFDNSTDASTVYSQTITKKSGVIYLVLDYSSSIGSKGASMKSAVKSFIRSLQQKSHDPFSVTSVTLDKTSLTLNEGESATLTATVLPDDATDNTVSWISSDESVVTVDADGKVTAVSKGTATIKAKANDGSGKYATCSVTVKRLVSSIELDNTSLTIHIGESVTLTAAVSPETADNTGITWTSSNTAVATVTSAGVVTGKAKGEATIKVTAKDGSGLSAECVVSVLNAEPEIVDLGLSVKWASFNLGATKAEDYGDYYAWGEIEPYYTVGHATDNPCNSWRDGKTGYNVESYRWCNGTWESAFLTKYNTMISYGVVDNRTVLEAEDDAAHAELGDAWRMPTAAEWDELQNTNNCTWAWTTQNGVKGYKVTSKKNGKNIFLSASGVRVDDARANVNSIGHYWLSSLNTDSPKSAFCGRFDSSSKTMLVYDRFQGKPIRPVYGEYIPVESISLDKTASVIWVGESLTLNATVSPSDATDKSVTWSSSNTAVAIVSSSGVVTAKSVGNATISVTTAYGLKTATCAVEVRQKVTSVTLNKTSLSLNEGESSTLTATVKPDNAYDKTVVWTSSDTSVAKVDGNGKVTSVSKGSATITATANDGSGKYATCSVTVKRLVSSIELDKTSLTLNVNESATLTATVLPATANNKTVSWSSSNTSVATVSSSGEVTGRARGEATITATAKDGSGVSVSCAVEVKQPVTSITLDQTSLSLNEGESAVLTPTVSPENANDKSVTWSSSDTSVAKVDGNGKVTSVSKGSATITATANDGSGETASCSVTVIRLVSAIELDKTSLTINVNESATLTATVLPATASNKNIAWSSSNTSVATVSASGVVTGKYMGEAIITAAAEDGSGITAECAVSVVIAVPEIVDLGLSVKWATFNLGATEPEEYGWYFAWGETEPKDVYSWSTYKWCNGSSKTLTKYNTKSSYGTVDNKTVLDPEDDVASVMLGGKWRMPTDAEWTELRNNCTWTWTSNYNGTGVSGRIVTSKVEGHKDKSIFLPAAGHRYATGLNDAGSFGYYWFSSLDAGKPSYAWSVDFYSGDAYTYGYLRYLGHSVRPVTE